MRAAQITRFDGPSAIEMVDVPIPDPSAGEVLIRVAATSVNSVDVAHRQGTLAFVTGRRFPQGIGVDAVGTVERLGSDVGGLVVGERVWAIRGGAAGLRNATGLASEFAVVDARRVAHAPESLSDAEAAALVGGGYAALRALRDQLHVQPGARVVIRGAAGGVGSAAVSIATAMGGRVAALASGRSADFVRSLGAIEAFDYSSATPSSVGPADAVFDTVGTELSSWRRILRRNGRMSTVALASPAAFAAIGVSAIHGSGRIRAFAGEAPAGHLAALTDFVDAHGIRPAIHATFGLDGIRRAHEAFAGRGVEGKLVITI
jgi:NADPH:quinone reductase-like Zn-dependent oxidoreductase